MSSKTEICPVCINTDEDTKSRAETSEWIECDKCSQWYHFTCLNISSKEAKLINSFHCPICTKIHGPSTQIRSSGRKRMHIDYVAFDRGEVNITRDRHPYAHRFDYLTTDASVKRQKRNWPNISDKPLNNVDGIQLTKKWVQTAGIIEPVRIPKEKYESLEMKIPEGLTVRKVAELLGDDKEVQVVDVLTQNLATPRWNMGQWADYYEKPIEERNRILNVISLEISGTKLGEQIIRPAIVRNMDLVDMVWPKELLEKNDYPKARLYCLMSVKDAYTDFHIDFGGTSVFYQLISGVKIFIFIRPTQTNLKKYEQWCQSPNQSSTFFGDLVRECHVVKITSGDSLIIPSGWIHAVYTPKDSLIIGGNFLTPINIPTQIALSKLESRTKVPQKFRYPFFDRVVWFAAVHYNAILSGSKDDSKLAIKLPNLEFEGLSDLRDYLKEHVKALEEGSQKSYVKHILSSLPKSIKGVKGARKFVDEFSDLIEKQSLSLSIIKKDEEMVKDYDTKLNKQVTTA